MSNVFVIRVFVGHHLETAQRNHPIISILLLIAPCGSCPSLNVLPQDEGFRVGIGIAFPATTIVAVPSDLLLLPPEIPQRTDDLRRRDVARVVSDQA